MKSKNKRLKNWIKTRDEKVIPMFQEKGINSCELEFSPKICTKKLFTGFAHRHERNWYYNKPELLGEFNQVILACSNCHAELDSSRDFRERIFKEIRDDT